MSQTDAARLMGMGTSGLSNYGHDVKQPGTLATKKMAQAYGVSAGFPLGLADEADSRDGGHISL